MAHLEVRNNLGQPGQFASTSTVDIKVGDNVIEHVRHYWTVKTLQPN